MYRETVGRFLYVGIQGEVLVCRDTGGRSLYVGIQGEVLVCRDTVGRCSFRRETVGVLFVRLINKTE